MVRVLGIDPGASSGAWAYFGDGLPTVGDLPVFDKNVNAAELTRLLCVMSPEVVIMERVGAMPHQGVSSVWTFGRGVGRIEGVIAGCEYRLEYVTPQVWKKHFHLPGGPKNKELSRAKAIELFPGVTGLSRKKDSGRAEALLIAQWYLEKHK